MTIAVQGDGVKALYQYLTAHASADIKKKHNAFFKAHEEAPDSVTTRELREMTEILRAIRAVDTTGSTPTLQALLRRQNGAWVASCIENEVAEQSEDATARAKYLEKRRRHLLRLDEAMRYGKLVKNLNQRTDHKELQRSMKSVRQHLSIGVNMIVARVTAFVIVYMVARPLTDNETTRIILGLTGAIGMMVIEMILFITRATKLESVEQKQQREPPKVF